MDMVNLDGPLSIMNIFIVLYNNILFLLNKINYQIYIQVDLYDSLLNLVNKIYKFKFRKIFFVFI